MSTDLDRVGMFTCFKPVGCDVGMVTLPFFWTATMSVVAFYVSSQREIGMSRWHRVKYLPFIMALGIGLCVNQAKAVIEALVGYETGFARTPQLGMTGARASGGRSWLQKRYRAIVPPQPLLDMAR